VEREADIEAKEENQWTPLRVAAECREKQVVSCSRMGMFLESRRTGEAHFMPLIRKEKNAAFFDQEVPRS